MYMKKNYSFNFNINIHGVTGNGIDYEHIMAMDLKRFSGGWIVMLLILKIF